MACTKNRSKICSRRASLVTLTSLYFLLLFPSLCIGAVASKFSLSVGEQYTDNVFFTKDKRHDFITIITPTLTLLYAPQGEPLPTLNLNISPSAQIFARHSDLNNFGETFSLDGGYIQRFSPRFSVHVSDTLSRSGESRTGDMGFGAGGLLDAPLAQPPSGSRASDSKSQNLKDFVSRGDQVTNRFSLQGTYLYSENATVTAGYINTYNTFIDQGGNEIFHSIAARGVYNWRREHRLNAGYEIRMGKSRNGEDSIIHDFDIGDDYFSNLQIRLSPTLTIAANTGVSFNFGNEGPGIANNTNITITKLWQTATLVGGFRKGLTPSFGVAGISDTTSFFSSFTTRLTERLSASSGVDFSLYDTDDVNFKTFQGKIGLQYLLTSWLSSNLGYSFRWVDRGSGNSDLLDKGIVRGNTIFFTLAAHFDLWPNTGLARSISSPTLSPLNRTSIPGNPSPDPITAP